MSEDPIEGHSIDQGAGGGNAEPEPASLRFLRLLVTVLTAVMIVGMVVLVALFLTRFPTSDSSTLPALPDRIALPEGAQAQAVTTGPGWLGVVTTDGRILFFDAASGALRDEVQVDLPR
jgi:hypothetical protein